MNWRNRKLPGAVAIIAAALGVVAPVSAQAQSGWQPNEDDFLLLQFTLGKYQFNTEVRGYQTDKGVCLDLADVIQSLDLPIRLDKKSRRATGWLFAEDQTFTIDREANTVQNVNIGKAPVNNEIYDTPEGWCVDSKALSRWFGIDMKPDLYNSAIRLDEHAKLPFIEALERKSRAARLRKPKQAFDLSAYPTAQTEYRMWRTPSVDTIVRAGFNGGTGQSRATMRYETYASGEMLGASYSARLASDDSLTPRSLRFTAFRQDPAGGLLGPLGATEVSAGDVEMPAGQLTGRSSVGRGAYISNQPLSRNSRYSTTELRGTMPGGWDAELYRNGQLIAYQGDGIDGRYEFLDIALYFGRNDFEIVLYGPQGQVRRIRESVPVGTNAVEPGKTYYWAGFLQEDRDLVEIGTPTSPDGGHWRWGVGVERGLSDRTSVALGVQSIFHAGRRREYVEANLVQGLGSMQLNLGGAWERGAGGVLQANALGRAGGVNFGVDAVWVQGDFSSEFVAPGTSYKVAFRADTSLKLGGLSLPLQASIGRAQLKNGQKVTEWLMATGANFLRTNWRAELRGAIADGSTTTTSTDPTMLRILASRRMFGLTLRGAADFNLSGKQKGFAAARLTTAKAIDDTSDITFELEHDAPSKETSFALGYSKSFKKFAVRANASYDTRGAIGFNLSLAFSFGPDPVNGGIRFSEEKLARNGQAKVIVFRDDNGDGRQDPGEEVLKNVNVEAGLRETGAVTSDRGMAMVDGLKPYVPIVVGVDEASLGDPYLTPSVKGVVVVPRPGVAAEVVIPVSPAGEIEGTLLSTNGTELPGVELELVDARGAVAATTMTEFDGFFLFEKVPYGRYRLRVSADAARALEVRAALASDIEVARGKDIARVGVIKLEDGGQLVAARVPPPGAIGGAP
ncbi:MAG: carboxypeptidase regulatory-like domain-containing protein [Sphingomonadales bacterium]|nr:carboxypeptidase regulatory-like domain-containing protein [Sphingomonadales bacterium]MBD3773610.1 carboxypeptidase regulatory-like domain-containing protein [Paracoccaceae bacterium]